MAAAINFTASVPDQVITRGIDLPDCSVSLDDGILKNPWPPAPVGPRAEVETLRERARRAYEKRSIPGGGREMGLGHTTFHNFVNKGTTPHARVRSSGGAVVAAQYADGEAEEDARGILLAALPAPGCGRACEDLIAFVRECT